MLQIVVLSCCIIIVKSNLLNGSASTQSNNCFGVLDPYMFRITKKRQHKIKLLYNIRLVYLAEGLKKC